MNKLSKLFLLLCVSLMTMSSSCEDEIPEPTTPAYLKTGNFFDCSAGETSSNYSDITDLKVKGDTYLFYEGKNLRIANNPDLSSATLVKNYDDEFFNPFDFELFGDDVLISDTDGLSLFDTGTGELTLLTEEQWQVLKVHNGEIYITLSSLSEYDNKQVYKYSIIAGSVQPLLQDPWRLATTFISDFDFDPQGNLLIKNSDNKFFVFDQNGDYVSSVVLPSTSDVPFTFFTKYAFEGENTFFATLDHEVGFQLVKKRGEEIIRLKTIQEDTDDEQEKLFVPNHVIGDMIIRDGKLYIGLYGTLASDCPSLFVFDITSDEELEPLEYYLLTEEGRDSQCINDIVETEEGDIIYISEGKAYRADCG